MFSKTIVLPVCMLNYKSNSNELQIYRKVPLLKAHYLNKNILFTIHQKLMFTIN